MTPSKARPRYAIAVAADLLASVGFSIVPLPTQAAAPEARRALGFRIDRTPHADGRWVGRSRIGAQRPYRTQPRKSNVESAYHARHRVAHVHGATLAATRRSAW